MISFRTFLLEQIEDVDHELAKKAADHFGYTNSHLETGYVSHEGKRLDLSGRHESGEFDKTPSGHWRTKPGKKDYFVGLRHTDHRDLPDFEPHNEASKHSSSDNMLEFMHRTKSIRVMPGVGMFTTHMPSDKQLETVVSGHNRHFRGEPMFVDVGHGDKHYKQFDRPTVEGVKAHLQKHFGVKK